MFRVYHFTGRTLTVENAREGVYAAYELAVDAARPLVRLPKHEGAVTLENYSALRRAVLEHPY
jgi:hypothetical protein